MKFEVYNNDSLLSKNTSTVDLINPTVNDIKLLLNPGTYTNIKSETFTGNGKTDLINQDIVNPTFVSYRIDLN
jgi:hypothetical protein